MNRIEAAIERKGQYISKRLSQGEITQEQVDAAHKSLDMEFDEFCKFQEAKSLAMLNDWLSLEEANTVYSYLGETVSHFNKQPIAIKAVLTGLFAEILTKRIDTKSKKQYA